MSLILGLKMMSKQNIDDLFEGLSNGNIVVLSKAITIIESKLSDNQIIADELLKKCLPNTGKSIRIGISGVPGAGKSSLIESLGAELLSRNHKIAILTIDPSSSKTKGSILGDKTRMEKLVQNPNVFIRPTATGEHLGGVASKTRETIFLCEVAGFDIIIVETVGVGQSEIMVHSMVDFFLYVQVAGAGDELQGIKKGIMEISDAIVVNKSDGANVSNTLQTKQILENALHLSNTANELWQTKVLTCSALENRGIIDIWLLIQQYVDIMKSNQSFYIKRKKQRDDWFYEVLDQTIKNKFYDNKSVKESIANQLNLIKENKITPYDAANFLWRLVEIEPH